MMETRAADPDVVALLVDVTWEPRHRSTGRRITAEEVRRLVNATDATTWPRSICSTPSVTSSGPSRG
jgi:hypothetical protein